MVFNRFWRADPARARTSGGTGLGLSISLEDTHLHGGWLQAWGRPGEGAQFRLTLPAAGRRHAAAEPDPVGPRGLAGDGVSSPTRPGHRLDPAATALLSGCLSLPESGPVQRRGHRRLVRRRGRLLLRAQRPPAAASRPTDMVQHFLDAMTATPDPDQRGAPVPHRVRPARLVGARGQRTYVYEEAPQPVQPDPPGRSRWTSTTPTPSTPRRLRRHAARRGEHAAVPDGLRGRRVAHRTSCPTP